MEDVTPSGGTVSAVTSSITIAVTNEGEFATIDKAMLGGSVYMCKETLDGESVVCLSREERRTIVITLMSIMMDINRVGHGRNA